MTARETKGTQAELCLHFFSQFFESEFVAVQGQMKVLLGSGVALLLSLAVPFVQSYYGKYRMLNRLEDPRPFYSALMADTLFLICGTMLVGAFATVFQWSSLFPSRRDYFALAALPIRPRQIFIGKFSALAVFLGSILLAVAAPASGLPGLAIGDHGHNLGIYVVAIFVSCMAAGLFVCLSLIAFQGLLLNLLPIRFYERISLPLQGLILLVLCALVPAVIATANLHGSMGLRPAWMFWAPPLWFLGMSQAIVGNADPAASTLGRIAIVSLMGAVAAALLSYFWSYRRHRVRVLESTQNPSTGPAQVWSRLADILIPNPRTQAAFSLIAKTLARSPQHRLILTVCAGGAVAVIAASLGGLSLTSLGSLPAARQATLSIPLILSLFLLAGFRFLFRLPYELRSNWLLRMNEPGHGVDLLAATEWFLYCAVVFPLTLLCLPGAILLFGWKSGLAATLLTIAPTPVLVEVLLFSFGRVPFTSSYFPGRKPLAETLIKGTITFLLYVSALSLIFAYCMESLFATSIVLLGLGALWWKARAGRMEVDRVARLEFEETQEPVVQLLGIGAD